MRLSTEYIEAITETFKKYFLPHDTLWLFGSRVDDAKKGGDIDLYIETHHATADLVVEIKLILFQVLLCVLVTKKLML